MGPALRHQGPRLVLDEPRPLRPRAAQRREGDHVQVQGQLRRGRRVSVALTTRVSVAPWQAATDAAGVRVPMLDGTASKRAVVQTRRPDGGHSEREGMRYTCVGTPEGRGALL